MRRLFGRSVEKNRLSGQKCLSWGQNSSFLERHPNFLLQSRQETKNAFFCADSVAIGMSAWPMHGLFGSKRAILGRQYQKTARRAAERERKGKPNVSRVTSGHGEVMIPLRQVHQRPKK